MTKVALRIFSIKLLKITYQIAKLINGKNPRAKTEERKMANTSVIVIPEGKICDYVDGKFRNDTPEEYVRQTTLSEVSQGARIQRLDRCY